MPLATLAHLFMAYILFSSLLSDDARESLTLLPPTSGTHEVQGEIWAIRFVLLSLALNGTYLLIFLAREWGYFFLGIKPRLTLPYALSKSCTEFCTAALPAFARCALHSMHTPSPELCVPQVSSWARTG